MGKGAIAPCPPCANGAVARSWWARFALPTLRTEREPVARFERCEIRGGASREKIPGFRFAQSRLRSFGFYFPATKTTSSINSASIPDLRNVTIASDGVQTIGSLSLKDVLITSGTPVSSWNAEISS